MNRSHHVTRPAPSQRVAAFARGILRELREAGLAAVSMIGALRGQRPHEKGRFRLVIDVPGIPPARKGGSERSIAAVASGLAQRGHRVLVVADEFDQEYAPAGVTVMAASRRNRRDAYRHADAALTQLEARDRALRRARMHGIPTIHFLRNGNLHEQSTFGIADLLVFNAEWLRRRHAGPERTLTVHPMIDLERYRTTPLQEGSITLVNLTERKGAPLFYELAQRLPHRPFLGVIGDYDEQIIPSELPDNVHLMPPQEDMRAVYSRTRILLMPSSFEPFGRVALEAAASGIPTIASPGPGIQEALGDAGRYAPRSEIEQWVAEIERLWDDDDYRELSARARQRADLMCRPAEALEVLEAGIRDVVAARRPYGRRRAAVRRRSNPNRREEGVLRAGPG